MIQERIVTDKILRNEYGWFPKISLLEDLSEIYAQYCQKTNYKIRKIDALKNFFNSHAPVVRIIELLLTFFVFEVLNRVAGNQVQFEMIDLRLVYIVLFSSLYGIIMDLHQQDWNPFRCWAAYAKTGIGWTTLFYEPSNWFHLSFISLSVQSVDMYD